MALTFQNQFYSDKVKLIVGVDEAGRGPLAGPVVAGAVIFSRAYINKEINDSKQLSEKKREELFEIIKRDALGYGIAKVEANKIDEVNIYEATKLAMKEAINKIQISYDLIITDAMPLEGFSCEVKPFIKGDARFLCIAAASILAKVSRDREMVKLGEIYKGFSFRIHKGYGTKLHLEELKKNGPIENVHRKSFKPVKDYFSQQIKLF